MAGMLLIGCQSMPDDSDARQMYEAERATIDVVDRDLRAAIALWPVPVV